MHACAVVGSGQIDVVRRLSAWWAQLGQDGQLSVLALGDDPDCSLEQVAGVAPVTLDALDPGLERIGAHLAACTRAELVRMLGPWLLAHVASSTGEPVTLVGPARFVTANISDDSAFLEWWRERSLQLAAEPDEWLRLARVLFPRVVAGTAHAGAHADATLELLRSIGDARYECDLLEPFATVLDPRTRRLVRGGLGNAPAACIPDGPPPSPLSDHGRDRLLTWLAAPGYGAAPAASAGRTLADLYESRSDLQSEFPEVTHGDANRLLAWASEHAEADEDLPTGLVARAVALARPSSTQPRPDVEVAGYLTADSGLGEAARLLVGGLEAAGVAVVTYTFEAAPSRLGTSFRERAPVRGQRADTAIACINADQLAAFVGEVGRGWFAGRHVIGMWFWEIGVLPQQHRKAFDLVDEVWVASEYVAAAIRPYSPVPVVVVPLPHQSPHRDDHSRGVHVDEATGAPTTRFLFTFDYLSVFERKNPLGLVEAWKCAFPQPGPERLVIKSVNAERDPDNHRRLRRAVAGRPDVELVDRYLDRVELDALMASSDCYVSLHRAEGYGLAMAEAMAAGIPVIATGYSGNLAFMDRGSAFLIRYSMVDVPAGCAQYPRNASWAEPDIEHAAELLRTVAAGGFAVRRRVRRARRRIARNHGPDAMARAAMRRLGHRHRSRRMWKAVP